MKRPGVSNGGSRPPYAEDCLYQYDPPETCPACTAAALGFLADSRLLYPKEIITQLHVSSGRTSAQQSKRELVDSERGAMV